MISRNKIKAVKAVQPLVEAGAMDLDSYMKYFTKVMMHDKFSAGQQELIKSIFVPFYQPDYRRIK